VQLLMQTMAMRCFLLSMLVAAVASIKFRANQNSGSATASTSAAWIAYSKMAVQERSFWFSELSSTEAALLLLQKAANVTTNNATIKGPIKTKVVNSTVAVVVGKAAPASKIATAKADLKSMDPSQMMKSLGIPSLHLSGNAALAPMLAMLKGLYADSKDRIAQQNAREEKSKKWFAEKETEHNNKLENIEAKHKKHTLDDEFYTNETHDENRYFQYWAGCRKRQHRQFHTNLKIQHAMMMKVKTMIGMYEKTMDGTADKEKMRRQLQVVSGGAPDVVLLEVQHFCHDALTEVLTSRHELEAWALDDRVEACDLAHK